MRVAAAAAAIVIFVTCVQAAEQAAVAERPLPQMYAELDALFRRYYPNVTSETRNDTIHFEFNTRVFSVHEPLKTGEWQDARDVRGPNRGGIRCEISVRNGRYPGAAVVPQTFDKRYFNLLVLAP